MMLPLRFISAGVFLTWCVFYSSVSFSWSAKGHSFVSMQAQSYLNKQDLVYLNELTRHLLKSSKMGGSASNSASYNKSQLPNSFERLSSWPDQIRDKSLQDIFAEYNEVVPDNLWLYKKYNTSDWHYSNFYIYASSKERFKCNLKKKGRLEERLLVLHETLQEDLSKTQEAIVLAFFIHLLQDMHQPLHLLSKVNGACSSDLGGNKACLKKGKPFVGRSKKRCRKNLHSLWDQGFDVFKSTSSNFISPKLEAPDDENSRSFSKKLVSSWIDNTRLLSDAVYSLNKVKSSIFSAISSELTYI